MLHASSPSCGACGPAVSLFLFIHTYMYFFDISLLLKWFVKQYVHNTNVL